MSLLHLSLRRDFLTVTFGAILCLGSRPALAQLYSSSTLDSQGTLYPTYPKLVSSDPAYVDLPVHDVLGIQGTTTSYSVDLISDGRLVTVHVSTGYSFFYTPISSASAQIFNRTLDLTMVRSNIYSVTLRNVWVYPRFSKVDYYANSRTILSFTRTTSMHFPGVDSLLWGSFGDPSGDFFGTFDLVDPSDRLALPDTYLLLKRPITGDCGSVDPMQLGPSSCGNLGVLDLLEEMFPYGAILIDGECRDSTRLDNFGGRTRIVHCTSGWWN